MLSQTRWTSTFLRWWFRMMDVVQAEVWRPDIGISWFCLLARDDGDGSSRSLRTCWFDLWLSRDPWEGGVWCRTVTPGCWNSVVIWGLWSQLRSPGGWFGLTAWIYFNQLRFLHFSRTCARWPYSPCYSLLLEYKYRIIHVKRKQCLLLGGFSVL